MEICDAERRTGPSLFSLPFLNKLSQRTYGCIRNLLGLEFIAFTEAYLSPTPVTKRKTLDSDQPSFSALSYIHICPA